MAKRKLYILQHDHSVIKSKKSVSELLKSETINDETEWVLIPIQNTSATYIAVSGATILLRKFSYAEIKFHMAFKVVGKTSDCKDREKTEYDYFTTSIFAYSIEELYNAIYNILFSLYLRDAIDATEEMDDYWFLDIQDYSITLYSDTQKPIFISEIIGSDIPFEYSSIYEMGKKLWDDFGLYGESGSNYHYLKDLYFFRDDKGDLRWGYYQTKIDLYSRIRQILLFNRETHSCVMLKRKEMDLMLKMHRGTLYISPIDLSCFPMKDRIDKLPVACDFQLKKYALTEWNQSSAEGDSPEFMVFEYYGPLVVELFSFVFYDPMDIAYALDNISYWLRIYQECGVVYHQSQSSGELSEADRNASTALLTFVGEIGDIKGAPADSNLVIYTDPYEDEIPNLHEVCAILDLQEKSS